MYILPALAFLFLAHAVLAQQPTPILADPKLTPGDIFDVTVQDICVPGYAKKVWAVPAWLKRQAYAAGAYSTTVIWLAVRTDKPRLSR
jgi:hypothetical protein